MPSKSSPAKRPRAKTTASKSKRSNASATSRRPARSKAKRAAKPKLLAGQNPQIRKGEGDAPVRAYIAAIPGWKRGIAHKLDTLVKRTVPKARKAIKWNSPFYGIEGKGWFLSFHCFTKYVKVTFFRGASLKPVPPGTSKHKDVRYVDIHEDDQFDAAQLKKWIRQAAALPGWTP